MVMGIGLDNPNAPLHIFEATGTGASATSGSLILEHGNGGGQSSIVFKSNINNGSDFGYISYQDDGSANGNTDENSLLTIGIENDMPGSFQDDINISSDGSLGINNTSPNGSASIDMGQNDRGILINRVQLTALNNTNPVSSPADGLLVYNTATSFSPSGYENDVRPGFYSYSVSRNRWIPQTPENRSARYTNTNTNTTFNLNQDTVQELPIFGSREWNDDGSLFQVTPSNTAHQLFIREDGRYRIVANISITTTGQRTNIDAEIGLQRGANVMTLGAVSSANYIRNINDHNHESTPNTIKRAESS